jgi:PAS domain S-box-containing protein
MNATELETYKAYVVSRLRELSPFLCKYALGDFTSEIEIPEQEDEFTELLVGISLMVEDFREMVAELQKTQQELLLKNIVFESSIAANSIAGTDGVINHVNKAFIEMWGYETKADAVGNSVASFFVNQEDAAPVMESLSQTGVWQGEFLAKKTTGDHFISQGYATTILDDYGELIGYQSTNLDITDQKRMAEELQSQWQQFLTILDNFPEVLYIADVETHEVLFVNKSFADALGEDPVGQKCYIAFQQLEQPCSFCTNQIIQEQEGTPYVWEYHNPVLDRFYLISDQLIEWTDRRNVRFEIAIDITDRKNQEEILQRHAQELAQKNKDLQRFNRMAIGREHRMIELKREVNALAEELGRESPYDLSFAE